MIRSTILSAAIGCGLAALALPAPAQAQDNGAFDNPGTGSGPCMVLNRFEVTDVPAGENSTAYRGMAILENICGRAMEVSFCFELSEPVDDQSRSCFLGSVRPWDRVSVEEPGAGARIVAPELEWRYLPVATGDGMTAS